MGRMSAIQKHQKTVHKAMRTGLIRIRIASAISMIPIKKSSCVVVSVSDTPNLANQLIQSFLPCRAKTPWPMNSPATAICKTHSIGFVVCSFIAVF